MFISTISCDWKCLIELGLDISICHNSQISNYETQNIPNNQIINQYLDNDLTSSIVIGGLEPILQIEELIDFIRLFRTFSNDDVVIYTGYYPQEILSELSQLKQFKNIVVKFGRYIQNSKLKYDNILGVTLASDNQFAEKIS